MLCKIIHLKSFFMCLIAVCNYCHAVTLSMENLVHAAGGLYVYQENINGTDHFVSDGTIVYFKEGEEIEYTCSQNYSSVSSFNSIQWIQERDGKNVFQGYTKINNKKSAQIQMKLYKFDNNSTISCTAVESKNYIIKVYLKLNETNSPMISYNHTELYTGQFFGMTCGLSTLDRMLAVNSNNSITNNHLFSFNMSEEYNGMTIFCIHLDLYDKTRVIITKREIYNLTQIKIKYDTTERSKPNYDTTSPTDTPSMNGLPITLGVVVILIIVLLLCALYICKKRKRIREPQQRSQHTEPLSAVSQQVIYAELELVRNVRTYPCQTVDANQYAEVIGILTPKDE